MAEVIEYSRTGNRRADGETAGFKERVILVLTGHRSLANLPGDALFQLGMILWYERDD